MAVKDKITSFDRKEDAEEKQYDFKRNAAKTVCLKFRK